jgi:hypothetical protein
MFFAGVQQRANGISELSNDATVNQGLNDIHCGGQKIAASAGVISSDAAVVAGISQWIAGAGRSGLPQFGGGPAEAAAEAGPKATLELAMEIQGSTPLSAQTVSLLETAEGPTLVGAGEADLSAQQVALAQSRGLTPTALEGFHAEQTVINGAGELGLTPTNGVATNNICAGRCGALIEEIGGTYSGRNFSFPSSQ